MRWIDLIWISKMKLNFKNDTQITQNYYLFIGGERNWHFSHIDLGDESEAPFSRNNRIHPSSWSVPWSSLPIQPPGCCSFIAFRTWDKIPYLIYCQIIVICNCLKLRGWDKINWPFILCNLLFLNSHLISNVQVILSHPPKKCPINLISRPEWLAYPLKSVLVAQPYLDLMVAHPKFQLECDIELRGRLLLAKDRWFRVMTWIIFLLIHGDNVDLITIIDPHKSS